MLRAKQPPSTALQGGLVKTLLTCLNIYAWQELSVVVQLPSVHVNLTDPFVNQFTTDLFLLYCSRLRGDVLCSSVHAAQQMIVRLIPWKGTFFIRDSLKNSVL